MKRKVFAWVALVIAATISSGATAAPETFSKAKKDLRQYVYFDRESTGDLYCGCKYHFKKSVGAGARVDLASCGYQVRKQKIRAERSEVEHLVPAENFGRALQCWQQGGRENCKEVSPVFNAMEADLHNLTIVVGEVNADRLNYRPAMLPGPANQYGACQTKVDFEGRKFEPRDEAKGMVARAYFYMHDRYDLNMSKSMQQLLMAWNKQFPVSNWEIERDRRIAPIMGHHNPFVTGEKTWALGHKNGGEGIAFLRTLPVNSKRSAKTVPKKQVVVKGNRRSMIYHLSEGCPSYNKVSAANTVMFQTEEEARNAGYRIAGNCDR